MSTAALLAESEGDVESSKIAENAFALIAMYFANLLAEPNTFNVDLVSLTIVSVLPFVPQIPLPR